jgi:hypothetical protein
MAPAPMIMMTGCIARPFGYGMIANTGIKPVSIAG